MARRTQTQAAQEAADPAAAADKDQTVPSATAPVAENSSDGTAETASTVDGAGEADAQPQPISSADSVSTSAGGEAAPSGAASDDTLSEHQPTDPAAPAEEAAASAEEAAGEEAAGEEEPELVLGLPPMVEIREGHVPRALVFAEVRRVLELDDADDDVSWNSLPEDKRHAAVAIGLAAMRSSAAAAAEIRALFEPTPDGMVEITAKSADGQPFTRGGVRWGDSYRTVTVSQEVYDRLVTDPHLAVKG